MTLTYIWPPPPVAWIFWTYSTSTSRAFFVLFYRTSMLFLLQKHEKVPVIWYSDSMCTVNLQSFTVAQRLFTVSQDEDLIIVCLWFCNSVPCPTPHAKVDAVPWTNFISVHFRTARHKWVNRASPVNSYCFPYWEISSPLRTVHSFSFPLSKTKWPVLFMGRGQD